MENNENKFLVKKSAFFMTLLFFTSPLVTMSQEVLIKDSNSSFSVSCNYKSLVISESGKMEILLNNYQSCVNPSNGDNNSGDPVEEKCIFNGINYSAGEIKKFYKNQTDCSNPITAICGTDSFPPNGYTVTECTEVPTFVPSGGWLTDTLNIGDNITSEDLYGGNGSPEGFKVYTLDGGRITAAPGCANNKGLNLCNKASDWLPGARTDEVYAIRGKKELSGAISIRFQPNPVGVNVQPAKYDVTISSNPGEMNHSVFDGPGCMKANNVQDTFKILLISDKNYNKYKGNLSDNSCYVPKGEKYYINIRATTSGCDLVGQKDPLERKDAKGNIIVLGPCNSYYEMH